MKDYCSILLHICNLLKTQDTVNFIVNGITVSVAWKLPKASCTEIHIEEESDESNGIIYRVGNTEEAKIKILNYDKVDYFNQNLIAPLLLDLDEMKKVLLAYCELESHCYVLISKSIYSIIPDKYEQ